MELKRRVALLVVTIWLIQLDFVDCKKKQKKEAKISERPWGPDYIKIVGKASDQDVENVYFQLFSTKQPPRSKDLKVKSFQDFENKKKLEGQLLEVSEKIVFDEKTQTAELKSGTIFDPTLKTIITAHGNKGMANDWSLGLQMWKYYSAVASEKEHYNIIAIRWGSGGSLRHAYTGKKAARMVQSLIEDYGLDVSDIHGIGFSYGGHVISAMATELYFSNLGQVDRLTLLDPGCHVKEYDSKELGNYKVDGFTKQYGLLNRNFAKFVDVYHSSKGYGVWDTGLGHVDVWLNGGLEPTVAGKNAPGAHHSSKDFFAATILANCDFMAWKCENPKWKAFIWKEWKKKDTCNYGDSDAISRKIGEYIDRDDTPQGNYLVFFTKDYDYSHDQKLKQTDKNCDELRR